MTVARELGVGVIGYGFMGKTHTYAHKTIPLYYDPPPVRTAMKVVCRANPQRLAEAVASGGFERTARSFEEVIADPEVDIVHICTPNAEHMPALRAAIAAGKHIYVDKPVTASLAEADELEGLLAGYAGKAQVALQYRFFPATLHARGLIEAGFVGPVTHFRAVYLHSGSVDPLKAVNWKSTAAAGGGAIRDLGPHILDLLWLLAGPFASALCVSRIWSPRRPSLDRPGETMTIDAEEAAAMLLRSADGAFGMLDISKIATGKENEMLIEIHGRHGAIRFNLDEPNYLDVYDARRPDGPLGGSAGWQRLACIQKYPPPGDKFPGGKNSLGWMRAFIHSIYSFLCAIAEGRQGSPTLAEGIHRQRLLEALVASAQRNEWVDLPPEPEGSR